MWGCVGGRRCGGCVGGRRRYCNSSTRNAGVGGGRGGEGWDMGKGSCMV